MKYFISVLLLITLNLNKSIATQLFGTYTINPLNSATITNFQNFYSAIAYLTGGTRTDGGPNNSSPYGVSGPVTFIVAAGTYSAQVNLTTTIGGTSPINTLTFDGGNGNASSRIITYAGTSTNYPTINITNNPYITFRNLTITNTGTSYAFGVLITGNSNCCRINNCLFNLQFFYSVSASYGINVGASVSSSTTSYRVDSVIIDSNFFLNSPYFGINLSGVSTSNPSVQCVVRFNTFSGTYLAISCSALNGLCIQNNLITGGGYGCTIGNCGNNGMNPLLVSGNKIIKTSHALNLTSCSSNLIKGFIINNMLGGGLITNYSSGLNISNCVNLCIANNSINYDIIATGASPQTNPLSFSGSNSSICVINNIASVKLNNNPVLPFYVVNSMSFDTMDYNVFYRADTSDHSLIYIFPNLYNSGNFKGAGGFNSHSMFLNPNFVNDTNLHISQACLRGMSLPYITTDIDGNTRNSPPNIGANEVQVNPNDVGAVAILSPTYPIGNGSQNLRVRLTNYGSNTVVSFNVNYKLNNNTPVTQAWSGILNPCDTVSILFSGALQLNIPSGINTLKVYTSLPNGTTDANPANDTVALSFMTAMNGTYVIGPAPSNYTSFGAAITDLNTLGIAGQVKFNVKTGTFNENLAITSPTGISAANYVSFTSAATNRDSVVVNANSGYVLNLAGSYFTFSNMTFNQQASTNAGVLMLSGNPSTDTIYNCKLIAPTSGSNSSNVVYGNGIVYNNLVLKKNLIQGGYNGLNLISGSSNYSNGLIVDSNVFQNTGYGHTLEYINNLKFRYNTITASANLMLFVEYTGPGYEFTANSASVTSGNTITAFLSYYGTGNSALHHKINSNIFTAASGGSINLFAPYYYSSFVDFYNNSLALGNGYLEIGYNSNDIRCYNNSVSSSNTGYSFYHNESGNSNMDVKNNVISNTGGGVALYWNSTPLASVYDYNNLYNTGTNLVSVNSGATNYASLSAWRGAYGMDKNSVSYRPGFTSAINNLQPNISDSACWSLNGRGIPTSWITTDINGNPRSTQASTGPSDIGTYEFTPIVNPPVAVASPASPVASSTQYFSFGSDTIASIQWGASVPAYLQAQLYSGTNPPALTGGNYMKTYWNFTAPAGSYNYNLSLNYKDPWIGTNPNETSLRLAKYVTSWTPFTGTSSAVDTVNNIITAIGVTGFGSFTGTNNFNPLPVTFLNFNAHLIDESEVQLTWQTSSEINNNHFEVERFPSTSSGNTLHPELVEGWEAIGKVKGNGTNNLTNIYQFTYYLNLSTYQPINIYYRIKQVDNNGQFEYSPIVSVNFKSNTLTDMVISPNPNHGIFSITKSNTTNETIEIFDMLGNRVYSGQVNSLSSQIDLSELNKGIYFVRFSSGITITNRKIVIE